MIPGQRRTLSSPCSPEQIYHALTARISDWWTSDFEGGASHPGDTFTVRFGSTFKTMRIVEAIPHRTVVWLCTDQRIEMPEGMAPLANPAEWVGQNIHWNIRAAGGGSVLEFFHEGLTPGVECWAVCESGWGQTLNSLVKLLECGTGQPFQVLDSGHLERAMKP